MPMPEQYDPDAILTDPSSHPIHKQYAAINIGIRDKGERWAKCANCGNPYQLTEEWGNETICSEECGDQFTAYLNDSLNEAVGFPGVDEWGEEW